MSNTRCFLIEYNMFVDMFITHNWDRTGKHRHLWNKIYQELCVEHGISIIEDPQCTCGCCDVE